MKWLNKEVKKENGMLIVGLFAFISWAIFEYIYPIWYLSLCYYIVAVGFFVYSLYLQYKNKPVS